MNVPKDIEILIIGGGLTGLTLGYYLSLQNKKFKIIESRPRIGGRVYSDSTDRGLSVELGATWLGKNHIHLLGLLEELGIEVFNQELGDKAIFEPISTSPPYLATMPKNDDPSMRIKGGTSNIIFTMSKIIGDQNIHINERVNSVTSKTDTIIVKTNQSTYHAEKVISTLPPNLAINSISFVPALSSEFSKIANSTHTWMGESIKVAVSFSSPFWRDQNKSATIMSNVGPITEMYEHNNFEDNQYALMGFMNGNFYTLNREERKAMVIQQLKKYYGSAAENYKAYHEKTWKTDEFTYFPYDAHILPHQNNGHSIYKNSFYNNRLFFGGSETSQVYPGYMEGAVFSAKMLAKNCIEI